MNLRTPSPQSNYRKHDMLAVGRTPNNVSTAVSSFLKRNTPHKHSQKVWRQFWTDFRRKKLLFEQEQEEFAKEKLKLVQIKEKEASLKKDEMLKLKIEESKR